jgi:peptidoglycan hydrolase-like protein with peptidoglycan-binding domain
MRLSGPVVLIALSLAVAGCGDDSVSTTSTAVGASTTVGVETATTETTATTVAPLTGTVQDVIGQMVEDPLFGSGAHLMEWEGTFAWSTTSIDGTTSELNRLAVNDITPPPATLGLAPGTLLLQVWIQNYDGDIIPSGVAVFTPSSDGWSASSVITSDAVFAFIETTTDYQADPVEGPVQVAFTVNSFDATAGPTFRADVSVFDYFNDSELAFVGEIECTFVGDSVDCTLLSDDGVLRPGDEGDAVEGLQEDLVALGYFAGPIDGVYGESTRLAVRDLQQDHRLSRDGKAGPNTQLMIADLVSGTSNIVMASPAGVGDVLFGVDDATAYAGLIGIFGAPDSTEDWYVDACDGNDWFKAHWGGFTAIFTDRDGFRSFDGWHVSDVTNVPSWLYFKYGIGPDTTWTYLQSIGAGWDSFEGGFWYQNTIGYNNGRFFPPFTNPPAGPTKVKSFGTGTGAFVSC